jgi:tight adherence protein B
MLLISFVFLLMLSMVFGVVVLVTRPSAQQNAVEHRLAEMLEAQSGFEQARRHFTGELMKEKERPGKVKSAVAGTRVAKYLQRLILQSQTKISLATVLQIIAAAFLGCGLLAWYITSEPAPAIVTALIAGYLPAAWLRYRRNKRLAAFNTALPDCIETCARSLRAGHSLVAALDIVAGEAPEPAKTEFREVFKKQNYGLPLRDAFLQMLDRVPSSDLQVMVTAFLVQRDTGGNLVDILDRLVFVIRERLRIQRDIRIHTAQGRFTGWVLCLLPLFLLLAINLVNPGYSTILFHDHTGRNMLYAGAGLLLAGGWLIRHIVNGIEV